MALFGDNLGHFETATATAVCHLVAIHIGAARERDHDAVLSNGTVCEGTRRQCMSIDPVARTEYQE